MEHHRDRMFTTAKLSTGEARLLLETRRLPGRLNAAESAVVLGFESHDIPVLVAQGLLKTLGKPAPNSIKFFASTQITQCSNDPAWLNRATIAIANHWRTKNQRKHLRSTP